jgi:hypothetical protein
MGTKNITDKRSLKTIASMIDYGISLNASVDFVLAMERVAAELGIREEIDTYSAFIYKRENGSIGFSSYMNRAPDNVTVDETEPEGGNENE